MIGDSAVVTAMSDNLDAATAGDVLAQLRFWMDSVGATSVVLDLSKVRFMDSSGLGAIISMRRTLEQVGGVLHVTDPQPGVLRLLEISGLAEVLLAKPASVRRTS